MKPYFQPIADLHTHTIVSPHAYSTITENAVAAAEQGMLAMATTDHGPKTGDGNHLWHFGNMRILPDMIGGIRHLRGAEVNVCDYNGALDVPERTLQQLDIRIASMHDSTMPYGTVEQITEAWAAVAQNPLIDIIGHCGSPQYAFDYERVIPLFAEHGKIVEINEGTFNVRRKSLETCAEIARLCAKHGVRVVVDSDAHYLSYVGRMDRAVALLEEVQFPKELIINSSRERFEAFLETKGLYL